MIYLANRYGAKSFIETGTHVGETVLFMADKSQFDRIHSIENSDFYINLIREHFQRVADDGNINVSNVKIWQGDSVKVLPEILAKTLERSLLWLDAHYSGENSSKGVDYDCTILKELEIIKSSPIKDHIIVIDDIDVCDSGYFDYPSLDDLTQAIFSINKDYLITIKYGVMFAEVPSTALKDEDYIKND